jgi:D-alanyl-D-alanine carboxypeptidase
MKFILPLFLLNFLFTNVCGQSVENRIDSLMNAIYKPDLPGAILAIQQHHKTIFEKAYGLADMVSKKRITADDNFNIGSLTKQFTAYALLTLLYEGKFSLDDSIGKFFQLPAPLSNIHINQLLNHSSGLPDHYHFTDTKQVKHATDKDVLFALQSADSLYFPSGTHYRYSNTAYCLLGLLIEKLSHLSYPDFLQARIFAPLGIEDASVFQMNKPVKRRVIGYDPYVNGKFKMSDAEESVFFSTEADGGIYISMNNYLKWCEAVESGVLSATPSIQAAWTGQTCVDTVTNLWYGYGWFVKQPISSQKLIYHTGFNGGFRTAVFMIPSLDYCVSIFSNRSDIDLEEIISWINNTLSIPDNSFIKSGPLESFIHSWPIFAPCKETKSFSTSFIRNWNAKGMVLN